MDLQQKKERLEKLREKIRWHKKKEQQFMHELSKKQKQKRTRQLILAGSLFEKAGILGKYDDDLPFILGYLYSSSEFYEKDESRSRFQKLGQSLEKEKGNE